MSVPHILMYHAGEEKGDIVVGLQKYEELYGMEPEGRIVLSI